MIIRREKKKSFKYIHSAFFQNMQLPQRSFQSQRKSHLYILVCGLSKIQKRLHRLFTLCCLYFSLSHQESTKETAVFQMEYPIYSQAILLPNGKEWISHFIFNCSSICIFICLLKRKYFSSAKYFLQVPFKHMVQYVYTYCRPSAV